MPLKDKQIYRVIDDVNSYYRINSESKRELLLNKYPNAAAAYSLRLLDGYYRGPLVRVRRNDGAEVDVYPDYNNELSLDSLVTNVVNDTTTDPVSDEDATFTKTLQSLGEFVYAPNYSTEPAVSATVCVWYDQSSTDGVANDNDASQNVADNQPLIVNAGVLVEENGKPALAEHSGAFKDLQVATINFSADSGSFIAVNKPTTSANEVYAFGSNLRLATNTGRNGYFAGSTYIYSTSSSANQALRVAFGGTTDAVAVNGASLTTGGAGNLALTLTAVRIYSSFQEFVVYPSNQSTNRTDIEEDINSFYQIDGYTPTPKLIDLTQALAVENGDTIADGTPAAAYSLRLLSSTYNGPLVRIRRTIDNTEVDVYPDSDGEFSIYSTIQDGGTELTTGVTGGSTDKTTLHEFLYGQDTDCMVVVWYDQSGNSNDATQTTTGNQPKIYDSSTGVITENGKPAVQTDGSNDSMALASTINFTDLTWLTVTKKSDATNKGSIIFYGSPSSGYGGDDVDNRGNPFLQVYGSEVLIQKQLGNTSASGGEINQHLSYYNRNGTNASGGINGEVNTEATVATTTYNLIELFRYGSDYNFEGLVQELVLYNSNKKSDRSGIESNINQHYNIY